MNVRKNEVVKHIQHANQPLKSYCGEEMSHTFFFSGIDHVLANWMAKGRLQPCFDCLKKAVAQVDCCFLEHYKDHSEKKCFKK